MDNQMTGEEKRELAKKNMLIDTLIYNGCVNPEGLRIIREYYTDKPNCLKKQKHPEQNMPGC